MNTEITASNTPHITNATPDELASAIGSENLAKIVQEAVDSHLDPQFLARLGIDPSQIDSIRDAAKQIAIDPGTPHVALNKSGQDALARTQGLLSDESLSALNKVGEVLGDLVSFTDNEPTTRLEKIVSGVPLIGKKVYHIIPGIKRKYRDSQSVSENIGRIASYASDQEKVLTDRAIEADGVLRSITETAVAVSIHAISFRIALEETRKELAELKARPNLTDFERAKVASLESKIFRITNRVNNYTTLYGKLMASIPNLTTAQQAAATLADKMNIMKDLVAPILTYEAYISSTNTLSAKAIEYSDAFDEAVRNMVRQNADDTKKNAVHAIKASQRTTLDDETLKYVFKRLKETRTEIAAELAKATSSMGNTPERLIATGNLAIPTDTPRSGPENP